MSLTSTAIVSRPTPFKNPLDGPAMRAPKGVTVLALTTSSPEQAWFFACAVVFTVISGIFLVLRMYTKLRIIRKVDVTDCLTVIVFILYLVMIAFARLIIAHGGGVHQWFVTLRELKELLFWMHVNEVIYPICIVLIKVTILLQYLRLLAPNRTVNREVWYGAWGIIIVTVLFYLPNFFANIFLCHPREKIWNPLLKVQPIGHCLNQRAIITAVGIFNIVSDIAILVLPTRSVWRLRIPTNKKIGICALFATGLLACGADTAMIVFLFRMTEHNADVTFNAAWMGTAALIDISLGVIVSCSLSLPRFFETKGRGFVTFLGYFSRPFTSLTGSRSNGTKCSQSKSGGSNASIPNQRSQRINRVTRGQTLSETNLTFDLEAYGGQKDKEGMPPATVHVAEFRPSEGRQSNDRRADMNYVV